MKIGEVGGALFFVGPGMNGPGVKCYSVCRKPVFTNRYLDYKT